MNTKQRLFFALWPDDEVRRAIVTESSRFLPLITGRSILPENYHITLHFIGSVNEDRKQCMHEAAQSIVAEAFSLTLDRFSYFDKASVFWMGAGDIDPALTYLHDVLGEALAACEFFCEERPYTPHVSLSRKTKPTIPDYADFAINWKIKDFVLVESKSTEAGVKYSVIESYPLNM